MRKVAYLLSIGLIFTIPWEAAIHVGSFGRISKAIGIIAASAWVLSVFLAGRTRVPHALVKGYFFFLIWNGLTLLWTIDVGATTKGFVTYFQLFGMILLLWDLYESKEQVHAGLQAFVLGAYVSCGSILVNWLTAPPTRFPEHQRVKALGFEVDGIALIIALAIPAAWYLAISPRIGRRSPTMTAANLAYVPVSAFAIVLTGTRGASLAAIPAILFILWTLRYTGLKRQLVGCIVLAAAVAGIAWYAPREPLERIAGSVSDIREGDSLSGRREIWPEGLQTFFENPVNGVGLDAFRASSSAGKEAHNTALSVLVETGIVGFVLLSGVLLRATWPAIRASGWEGWFWQAQFAALLLGSMSLSLEDSKSVWVLLTLGVASAAVSHGGELEHLGEEPLGDPSRAAASLV